MLPFLVVEKPGQRRGRLFCPGGAMGKGDQETAVTTTKCRCCGYGKAQRSELGKQRGNWKSHGNVKRMFFEFLPFSMKAHRCKWQESKNLKITSGSQLVICVSPWNAQETPTLAEEGVPPESKALFSQCSGSRLLPAVVYMPTPYLNIWPHL